MDAPDARLRPRAGWSPLHNAAVVGDEAAVARLLDDAAAAGGADSVQLRLATQTPHERHSVLHVAARGLHVDLVRLLIDRAGASGAEQLANMQNSQGRTALHLVVQEASASGEAAAAGVLVLACLIRAKARVDLADMTGVLPLHVAANTNLEACARLLLDAPGGADTPARKDALGMTALHHAAYTNSVDVLRSMCRVRPVSALDEPDDAGATALHLAARMGHADAVSALAAAGAACVPLARVPGGLELTPQSMNWLPHHDAVAGDHAECLAALLGAFPMDINALARRGASLLHLAATANCAAVVPPLVGAGAALALVDRFEHPASQSYGLRPLHTAARADAPAALVALLIAGAQPDALDGVRGVTALHCAVEAGSARCASALLAAVAGEAPTLALVSAEGVGSAVHLAAALNALPILRLFAERTPTAIAALDEHADGGPLHAAARHGACEAVALLVDAGAPVNAATAAGVTPLHAAVAAGQTRAATLLLQRGAQLEARSQSGTPLALAAACGQFDCARLLLAAGADARAPASDGATPIHYAAHADAPALLQLLTDAAARAGHVDAAGVASEDGMTPLHVAAAAHALGALRWLVAKQGAGGVQLNAAASDGSTALHLALANAGSRQAAAIAALVGGGYDLTQLSPLGTTLLHDAAASGALAWLDALAPHVTCCDAPDADGHSALHHAVFHGNAAVVARLLALGASPQAAAGAAGPLHVAIAHGHVALLPLLLGAGADPAARDATGLTPLHVAARCGAVPAMDALLAAGAPIDARDATQLTPLLLAIANGRTAAALALLRAGADARAADAAGHGALHYAAHAASVDVLTAAIARLGPAAVRRAVAANGQTPLHSAVGGTGGARLVGLVVATLARAGVPIDAYDTTGATALHRAAATDDEAAARALLDEHAREGVRDAFDRSPLDLALASGAGRVAALLQGRALAVVDRNAERAVVRLQALARAFAVRGCYELTAALRTARAADSPAAMAAQALAPGWAIACEGADAAAAEAAAGAAAAAAADGAAGLTVVSLVEPSGELRDWTLWAAAAAGNAVALRAVIDASNARHGARARARLADGGASTSTSASAAGAGCDVFRYDNDELGRGFGPLGLRPMHVAVLGGSAKCVTALLEDGPSADLPDALGRTALHVAVARGAVAQATALLANGCSALARDAAGHTPLHYVCAQRLHEVAVPRADQARLIALLLGARAQPDVADSRGRTALHVAAAHGNADAAAQLCAALASTHLRTSLGLTALHVAAYVGTADVVTVLLRSTADMLATTAGAERTALHLAAVHGHTAVLAALRAADTAALRLLLAARDRLGYTPLHLAALFGRGAMTAALLAAAPALASAQTPRGVTALHCAAIGGAPTCVAALLRSGAELGACCQSGVDPRLDVAAAPSPLAAQEAPTSPQAQPLQSPPTLARRRTLSSGGMLGARRGRAPSAAGSGIEVAVLPAPSTADAPVFALEPAAIAVAAGAGAGVLAAAVGAAGSVSGASSQAAGAALAALSECSGDDESSSRAAGRARRSEAASGDWTALRFAVRCGQVTACQLLLDAGALAQEPGPPAGLRSLMFAAAATPTLSRAMVRVLVRAGLSVLQPLGAEALMPLHVAVLAAPVDSAGGMAVLQRYGDALGLATGAGQLTALHLAALHGKAAAVELCLRAHASVLARDARGRTPVECAVLAESEPCLAVFARFVSLRRLHALHSAACLDRAAMVDLLLERREWGLRVDARDALGRTPLHCAAQHGHTAALAALLRRGASLSERNTRGNCALHVAAKYGHTEAALLACGSDVPGACALLQARNDAGQLPMHLAACYNHHATLEALLRRADGVLGPAASAELLHVTDAAGLDVLDVAAQLAAPDCLLLCLAFGADALRAKPVFPMHRAAALGNARVLGILQARWVDANMAVDGLVDSGGNSILHCAIAADSLETVQTALACCSSEALLRRNSAGQPPAHACVLGGNIDMLRMLIASDERVLREKDSSGRTLLHLAAAQAHCEAVDLVLKNTGTSLVGVRDANGLLALHMVGAAGDEDDAMRVVYSLATAGADVNAPRPDGATLLQSAIVRGQNGLARVLLALDATVQQRCIALARDAALKLALTQRWAQRSRRALEAREALAAEQERAARARPASADSAAEAQAAVRSAYCVDSLAELEAAAWGWERLPAPAGLGAGGGMPAPRFAQSRTLQAEATAAAAATAATASPEAAAKAATLAAAAATSAAAVAVAATPRAVAGTPSAVAGTPSAVEATPSAVAGTPSAVAGTPSAVAVEAAPAASDASPARTPAPASASSLALPLPHNRKVLLLPRLYVPAATRVVVQTRVAQPLPALPVSVRERAHFRVLHTAEGGGGGGFTGAKLSLCFSPRLPTGRSGAPASASPRRARAKTRAPVPPQTVTRLVEGAYDAAFEPRTRPRMRILWSIYNANESPRTWRQSDAKEFEAVQRVLLATQPPQAHASASASDAGGDEAVQPQLQPQLPHSQPRVGLAAAVRDNRSRLQRFARLASDFECAAAETELRRAARQAAAEQALAASGPPPPIPVQRETKPLDFDSGSEESASAEEPSAAAPASAGPAVRLLAQSAYERGRVRRQRASAAGDLAVLIGRA